MFDLLLEMGICLTALKKSQSVTQSSWGFFWTHGFDQDVVQWKLKNVLENNISFVRFKILMERI